MVAIDMESYPNVIEASKPSEGVLFLPRREDVVVKARSEHGHYDEYGNLTVAPLEIRPQKG